MFFTVVVIVIVEAGEEKVHQPEKSIFFLWREAETMVWVTGSAACSAKPE